MLFCGKIQSLNLSDLKQQEQGLLLWVHGERVRLYRAAVLPSDSVTLALQHSAPLPKQKVDQLFLQEKRRN